MSTADTSLSTRREPAWWAGAAATVVTLVVAFGLDLSTEQTGAISAVAAAVAALVTAWKVRPVQPAVFSGAAQAVIALVISFGLDLSPEQVGSIMGALALVLSFTAVRPQVTPV